MSLVVTIPVVFLVAALLLELPPRKPLNMGKVVFFPGSWPGLCAAVVRRLLLNLGESMPMSLEKPDYDCFTTFGDSGDSYLTLFG